MFLCAIRLLFGYVDYVFTFPSNWKDQGMSQLRSVTNEAQKKDYGMGRNSLSEDLETSSAKNCGRCLWKGWFLEICPEASNPIIFARTETTHIPKHLLEVSQHQKLRDAIYSAQEDGSLKPTPLDSIKETDSDEENEQLIKPRKMGVRCLLRGKL